MPSLSDFSPEQLETIRSWVAAGDGLSEVQRKLQSELNVTLTYLDARILMSELQVTPATVHSAGMAAPLKEEPKPEAAETDALPGEGATDDEYPEDGFQPGPAEPAEGSAQVTLDQVVIPGAMVSGSVVFGDGNRAAWYVDSQGRLGFDPSTPGYRPSSEDLMAFQRELRALLSQGGY